MVLPKYSLSTGICVTCLAALLLWLNLNESVSVKSKATGPLLEVRISQGFPLPVKVRSGNAIASADLDTYLQKRQARQNASPRTHLSDPDFSAPVKVQTEEKGELLVEMESATSPTFIFLDILIGVGLLFSAAVVIEVGFDFIGWALEKPTRPNPPSES